MANLEDRLNYDKDTSRLMLAFQEELDQPSLVMSPMIRVPISGQYASYGAGAFRFSGSTKRAIGDSDVKKYDFTGATWTSYHLEEHSLETGVDRMILGRSGAVKGLYENDLTAKGKLMKGALDQELIDIIIAKAKAIGASYKSTPTTKWDAASGQTPLADLRAAAVTVAEGCGKWPNYLLMEAECLATLADWARTHYGYAGIESNMAVVNKVVMPHIGIPNLLESKARTHDGTNYQSPWGDAGMLFYAKTAPVIGDVTFMGTMVPDDVPDYRQTPPYKYPQGTGTFVQGIREYFVTFVCEAAGHYLYNILT